MEEHSPLEVIHETPRKVPTNIHAVLVARGEDRGRVPLEVVHAVRVRERLLELFGRRGGERWGQAPDVVRVGECVEAEWTACVRPSGQR